MDRDGQIVVLNQSVMDRDSQIADLTQSVMDGDVQISNLRQLVMDKDGQIANLNQVLMDREGQIASLNQSVMDRDGQIVNLSQHVKDSEWQLTVLLNTRSWRYTKIIRWAVRKAASVISLFRSITIQRMLRYLFRRLPFSIATKNSIKNVVFKNLNFIFKESEAYRVWNRMNSLEKNVHVPTNNVHIDSRLLQCSPKVASKILVIDASTPTPDRDAGSLTSWFFLKSMVELGYEVTFIPHDLKYLGKYTENIRSLGVRVLTCNEITTIETFLKANGQEIDIAFLYRVHTAISYLSMIKLHAPSAKLIFDTVDLHYLREEREAKLTGDIGKIEAAKYTKEAEYKMMRESDGTIVLSQIERDIIKSEDPEISVCIIPLLLDIPGCNNSFSNRSDIIFIGGFLHQPNVDAIKYFVCEIWPMVRERLPKASFIVVGGDVPKEVMAFAESDSRIKIMGYVEDLSPLFNKIKLSVAPLRYGAGIKGKIGTSASYGVPCVATTIAVEGMGLEGGDQVLIADEPTKFADQLCELYTDEELWARISESSLNFVDKNYSYINGKNKLANLIKSLHLDSDHAIQPSRASYSLSDKAMLKHGARIDTKIGVVIELSSFDKGGLEKVVLDSAIAFNKERYKVTIVTLGNIGHLGQIAREAGLTVIGLPSDCPEVAYEQILKNAKIDIAMSHFSDFGYPIFKKLNIPNVTFIHNIYAFFSDEQKCAFVANDRYVDRYVSVSLNATRYAVKALHIPSSKIETIPNGLILSEHEAREKRSIKLTRSELGLKESDYVFANVASYNLHKGHYLMADAMLQLLKRRSDVKILCVGNIVYPPHFEDLTAHLKKHSLTEHILMPGYVADVASVHGIADAFLLPSFIEGWSIAMNEAMFYRKPMILTDTGASAEVIKRNDIGILIPNEYGDIENLNSKLLDELAYSPRQYQTSSKLADALDNMASNRIEWSERAKLGRKKIYQLYDFAKIVSRYELLMEEIIRNKNSEESV